MRVNTSRGRRRVAQVAGLVVAAAACLSMGSVTATAASLSSLPGSVPAWATARADRGPAPSGTKLSVHVYLNSSDPAGLAAYARAVSDPRSPLYRHFISPAQQRARFGMSAARVTAVRAWLAGAGMKVTKVTEQYVAASGDIAAADTAFRTTLDNYAVPGHIYYAPKTAATVPAALASTVMGVDGLTDRPRMARPALERPRSADGSYAGVEPCSKYWGQVTAPDMPPAYGGQAPSALCGYLPDQVRSAYGVAQSGLTGKGQTVAVMDVFGSPTMQSDADTFAANHGLAPFRPGQYTEDVTSSAWTNYAACGGSIWTQEESLDIESVHTMAPDAHVVYVGANSCLDSDMIAALGEIVDKHLASIVSNSWDLDLFDTIGNEPQSAIDAYNQVMEEGAVEGIGFYFVTGDCSTNDPAIVNTGTLCDPFSSQPQPVFPASSPWATAMGATTTAIGQDNRILWQTAMGDTNATQASATSWGTLPGAFYFGGGGGTSSVFAQPWYQRGTVPASLADQVMTGGTSATPMRVVPDVSMNGDAYASTMIGFTQPLAGGTTGYAEWGVGGTSVAAPMFAGIQADAQQALGGSIGFANPEIYLREQTLGGRVFTDVTTDQPGGHTEAMAVPSDPAVLNGMHTGVLATLGTDWTLQATPGYDDATGIGSPNAGYLESFTRG